MGEALILSSRAFGRRTDRGPAAIGLPNTPQQPQHFATLERYEDSHHDRSQ
ncbi:MAG: hypothetical protein R3C56_40750 [Pirellulaceae bacterium]